MADEFTGQGYAICTYPLIKSAKYCELGLPVTDYRLMSANTKRAPKTQVANGLQDAGFSTAIFTV